MIVECGRRICTDGVWWRCVLANKHTGRCAPRPDEYDPATGRLTRNVKPGDEGGS